jgi:23S rRNA (pseudouridine1915-N3)-methyltransferase
MNTPSDCRFISNLIWRLFQISKTYENGKNFSSVGFSEELQKKMNSGVKTLVFVIGGPYGFSETVYAKANGKISLSLMTFSHQMVRLFFIEQVYRGFTILKNEPYHHQ